MIREEAHNMQAALITGKFDHLRCELDRRSIIETVGKGFDQSNNDRFQLKRHRLNTEASLFGKKLSNGMRTGI